MSLGLKLDAKAGVATITLIASGASAAEWFGVGFNATSMASLPYAIIVDGVAAGSTAPPTVHERVLGNHDAGSDLGPSAIEVRLIVFFWLVPFVSGGQSHTHYEVFNSSRFHLYPWLV